MPECHGANAKKCLARTRASGFRLSAQAKPSCESGAFYFPWLNRPDFYRSGLPTRTLAAHFAGTIPKGCANAQNLVDAFRKSVRYSIRKLRNHPEPSQRKQKKKDR